MANYFYDDYTELRPGMGWDADLPVAEKKLWVAWFQSLLDPTEATFPRSTKPPGAVGSPRLVGFGDASMVALCVVLYVVWGDSQGKNHSRILTARCRVAPLLGTTIPRGELQALVVLHRLALTVLQAFPLRFLSVSLFTDSMCSVGALKKPTSSMKPFFGNRASEIGRIREQMKDYTDNLQPVSHIPGDWNPADVGTRGLVGVGDLGPGSAWQVGPAFLSQDFTKWPRDEGDDRVEDSVPVEECSATDRPSASRRPEEPAPR